MIDTEKLKFGFEIELEYDVDKRRGQINAGRYHGPRKLGRTAYWRVEEDGSLGTEDFDEGQTIEVTTIPIRLSEIPLALKEFKTFFAQKRGYALTDVISFNGTTGAHIHVSYDAKPVRAMFMRWKETLLKEIVTKRMNEAVAEGKLTQKHVTKFLEDYYRSYSKEATKVRHTERYASINFNGTPATFEWRSFHLRGVTTWEQLETYYKVATDSIIEFLNIVSEDKVLHTVKEKTPIRANKETTLTYSSLVLEVSDIL